MSSINFGGADVSKIDNKAVDGLAGVSNSLAYKVHEIEKHLHSSGSWFGEAATPTATHFGDRIGDGISPYQIDAGNVTWGTWVQLLGSSDTPARTSQLFFDPHEIVVVATEQTDTYFVQFGRGASGAAALSAGTYTEFVYHSGTNKYSGILKIQTGRAPAGSLLWARCLALTSNTGTMDFYMGIHEYVG